MKTHAATSAASPPAADSRSTIAQRPYPEALRRTIARERMATIVIQLTIGAALYYFRGMGAMLRVWFLPYFIVFPIAFTINRLGQHYNIDPTNPLKWSTVMQPSGIWDFLFVYSNYHAEHHYFPRVPFYNLASSTGSCVRCTRNWDSSRTPTATSSASGSC